MGDLRLLEHSSDRLAALDANVAPFEAAGAGKVQSRHEADAGKGQRYHSSDSKATVMRRGLIRNEAARRSAGTIAGISGCSVRAGAASTRLSEVIELVLRASQMALMPSAL